MPVDLISGGIPLAPARWLIRGLLAYRRPGAWTLPGKGTPHAVEPEARGRASVALSDRW